MIYSIFPSRDATIYENTQSANTGIDEILEISKVVSSSMEPGVFNSRILIDFNTDEVSQSIGTGEITDTNGNDPKFFIKLFNLSQEQVPFNYTLAIAPVSESWNMGLGKSTHSPLTKEGVSWKYRDGYTPNTRWGSPGVAVPGGTTVTESGYVRTQSFDNMSADIDIDISALVTSSFISGELAYQNNGYLIQRSGSQETDGVRYGSLKFFSAETHTIYSPRLEVKWDDSTHATGSLKALTADNIIVKGTNIKSEYKEKSKIRIRLKGCEQYPTKSYATSTYSNSGYTTQYLNATSYYSIIDMATGETIIHFDTSYTKISCDSQGNYFNLWTHSLLPERVYGIEVRLDNRQYTYQEEYYKVDTVFRIVR